MTTTPTATTFTRMDESTAEQWGVIAAESIGNQSRVAEGVLEMLRSLVGDHRRVRGRPAHPLPADGDPGGAGGRRRRGGRRLAVPRHRQSGERRQPPADRGRDPPSLRARGSALDDRGAPGLPGPALLPPSRRRPRGTRASTGSTSRSPSRSGSPTSGTRSRSTRATTRSRSSTSRSGCERSSPTRR